MKYVIYHPGYERYAGSTYDWTTRYAIDLLIFDTREGAEVFLRAYIWEPEAVVQECPSDVRS